MQRYFSSKIENDYFYLNEDDIYHIKKVMRNKDGDLVEIVYDSKVFISKIEDMNTNIRFRIINEKDNFITNKPYITLIIPYLKETKMDLIFQKATEMGVDEFILLSMEHCMVKIDSNKIENKKNRWMRICKEASEQSKRISIPIINIFNSINDLNNLSGYNFTCSTQEKSNNIKKVLKTIKSCDRINLVIGPEGGISNKEEEILNNIGFKSISLGSLIMRVETVPLFLMSIINYEYME